MKINNEDDYKKFLINGKEFVACRNIHNGFEVFEKDDPCHTGFYFENIENFVYFVNCLTEIGKKFKEEVENENKGNI